MLLMKGNPFGYGGQTNPGIQKRVNESVSYVEHHPSDILVTVGRFENFNVLIHNADDLVKSADPQTDGGLVKQVRQS